MNFIVLIINLLITLFFDCVFHVNKMLYVCGGFKTYSYMTTLKAQINTKSNYRNLNGKYVDIIQFLGSIVYCQYTNESGDLVKCDFGIKEITRIIEFKN